MVRLAGIEPARGLTSSDFLTTIVFTTTEIVFVVWTMPLPFIYN